MRESSRYLFVKAGAAHRGSFGTGVKSKITSTACQGMTSRDRTAALQDWQTAEFRLLKVVAGVSTSGTENRMERKQ